jgi:membrane-bound lytic murein transglycosylase D
MNRSRLLPLCAACAILLAGACAPRHTAQAPQAPSLPPPRVLELPPVVEIWPALDEADIEAPEIEAEPITDEEAAVLRGVLAGVDLGSFDMPVHVNDHVLAYIDIFTGRARPRFEVWLARQGRYADYIDEQLRARGLPRELMYLALIESGYSPVAVSHANAVGLWQFIASTGRLEGLEINDLVDERRDPLRATEAALQHLEKLFNRFGSWYLAAAAYNAGAGRIERALAAGVGGQRGDDALFWQIRHLLPTETRNYVPQLIAASIIGTHRHIFGFEHIAPEAPFTFDLASIPDATEFAVIAEAAGIEKSVVAAYNPHFRREMTPPGRSVAIRLPPGYGEPFSIAYAAIPPDQRVRTRTHIVRAGETLSGIARRYGTSVAILQATNGIARPDRIATGRRLVIPVAGATRTAAAPAAAVRSGAGNSRAAGQPVADSDGRYVVRRGDTLSGIARRHGLSLQQLTSLNGISASTTIRPGQVLRVRRGTVYHVQPGDTISSIARRHGVSARELMEWNALESDRIRPGDRLEVRR